MRTLPTTRVLTSVERAMRMLREGTPGKNSGLAALSAQEHRVLALVSEGLTNKEVADKLGLSDNTVKNYLVGVFEKLQALTFFELVIAPIFPMVVTISESEVLFSRTFDNP